MQSIERIHVLLPRWVYVYINCFLNTLLSYFLSMSCSFFFFHFKCICIVAWFCVPLKGRWKVNMFYMQSQLTVWYDKFVKMKVNEWNVYCYFMQSFIVILCSHFASYSNAWNILGCFKVDFAYNHILGDTWEMSDWMTMTGLCWVCFLLLVHVLWSQQFIVMALIDKKLYQQLVREII